MLSGVGDPRVAIIPPVAASCDPTIEPNCDLVFALRVSFGVTSLPTVFIVFIGVSFTEAWSNRGGGAACFDRMLRSDAADVPFNVSLPGPALKIVDPGVP